jgi:hypothetical protein
LSEGSTKHNPHIDRFEDALPTFLGIGAQRAGTTWLHHCLAEHPDIYMPEKKEQRFFNFNWNKGLEHYKTAFKDGKAFRVRGEITPDYYHNLSAMQRIRETLPEVKLVFIMRNPIERAYSQYELYYGTEHRKMSFQETYFAHPEIIEWGMYGKHVESILRLFNKESIHFVEYEALLTSPVETLASIFQFVGADSSFIPSSISKTYNKVIFPEAQRLLRHARLGALIDVLKSTRAGDSMKNWLRGRNKPTIGIHDRRYLATQFYPDIIKLGELLECDYSHWLEEAQLTKV